MKFTSRYCKSILFTAAATVLVVAVAAQAQNSRSEGDAAADETKPAPTVIKRRPLVVQDPRSYRIPLRLEPVKSIALVAPADGFVQSVHVDAGKQLPPQGEVVRMVDDRAALLVRQAQAVVEARRIEQQIAEKKGGDEAPLAAANLEAAKAALDVAELDLKKLEIRAPFAGTVLKVHVVAGQFVRAGDPVAELADLSTLVAQIPVERSKVKAGERVSVTVETEQVNAALKAVLPPPAEYEPLRDLVDSLAAGQIEISNSDGKLQPGQAVHVNWIPNDPVAIVPAVAVSNTDAGKRKVQVIREMTVRDVEITPLAQIGTERIYVSGEFSPYDEVVVTSSVELADGMLLRPWIEEVDNPSAEDKAETKPRQEKKSGGL